MATFVVRPCRLLLGVLLACIFVALVVAVAPPPAAAAPAQSVLVVRGAGDHDALWLLDPSTGTPTAAAELPGKAGVVAISPDRSNAAYLPASMAPRVWIGYGPLGRKTISLRQAGVRRADSLTWVDDHRLLVSGAVSAKASYYQDGLYLVNVTTGRVSSFRGLRGVEPYGVPALGKVVYSKLTLLRAGSAANGYARTVRESLRVVKISGGTGRTITSRTYTTRVDHRQFARPQLSDDGKWLLLSTTGSDVSVKFSVCGSSSSPLFNVFAASRDVKAGWNAEGLTAFAGTPFGSGDDESRVWVCDPVRSTMACTASGLLPDMMMTDLDWAAGGDLVAGAISYATTSPTRRVYVISGSLTGATHLGTGRLPVWVQP